MSTDPIRTARFSHVGIVSRGLEETRSFYEDLLGFSRIFDSTREDTTRQSGFALDDILIELIQYPEGHPSLARRTQQKAAFSHIGVTVENLEAAHEVVLRRSIPILDGPRQAGPARILYILDPEGHPVELVQFEGGEKRSMELFRPGGALTDKRD